MQQPNNNTDSIQQLLLQQTELKAGQTAHKLLAQTTLEHMKATVLTSQRQYDTVQRLRRRMLFSPSRTARKFYKLFWFIGITKVHFVFFADYQMVCNHLF